MKVLGLVIMLCAIPVASLGGLGLAACLITAWQVFRRTPPAGWDRLNAEHDAILKELYSEASEEERQRAMAFVRRRRFLSELRTAGAYLVLACLFGLQFWFGLLSFRWAAEDAMEGLRFIGVGVAFFVAALAYFVCRMISSRRKLARLAMEIEAEGD